jgi:hypothetical protein
MRRSGAEDRPGFGDPAAQARETSISSYAPPSVALNRYPQEPIPTELPKRAADLRPAARPRGASPMAKLADRLTAVWTRTRKKAPDELGAARPMVDRDRQIVEGESARVRHARSPARERLAAGIRAAKAKISARKVMRAERNGPEPLRGPD